MDVKLKSEILEKIKPTETEHSIMQTEVDNILNQLKESAKQQKIDCTFYIGGSFGKNTYLKNSSDVDLFIRFDFKHKDNTLSEKAEQILKNTNIKYQKQKGSRDYFSFQIYNKQLKKNINFELVPNYNITKQADVKKAKNSTDVSPLHVEFLNKKAKTNSNLRDEIRLAKLFFKSKELYGAESYIQGFSGHIIDILIAKYGSLENLIKDAKNWEETKYIDINNFYKNEKEALKKIEKDKISKLIIVDPIIKTRNAAKALSNKNYNKFLFIAKTFESFTKSDFIVKKFNHHKTIKATKKFAKANNLKGLFYIFKIEHDYNTTDIIGSKLLKISGKLEKKFKDYDFRIFNNEFYLDLDKKVALFTLLFENDTVPKVKKIMGPKVYMKDALRNFIKNRTFFLLEEDRVYSYEQRKVTKLKQISALTKQDCEELLNKNVDFIKKIKIGKI